MAAVDSDEQYLADLVYSPFDAASFGFDRDENLPSFANQAMNLLDSDEKYLEDLIYSPLDEASFGFDTEMGDETNSFPVESQPSSENSIAKAWSAQGMINDAIAIVWGEIGEDPDYRSLPMENLPSSEHQDSFIVAFKGLELSTKPRVQAKKVVRQGSKAKGHRKSYNSLFKRKVSIKRRNMKAQYLAK